MCLYTKYVKNRKYTATKKNGGVIPAITDIRTNVIPTKCGKCIECRKAKGRDWQIRMLEHIKDRTNGIMITLTFSNESIKELSAGIHEKGYKKDNAIGKLAVRRFLERYRKKYGKSCEHWLVSELGHTGTENLHFHGILFTDKTPKEIEERWQYGYIWCGTYVNERTVNYTVKYIHKQDKIHTEYKPMVLATAGMGKGYIHRYNAQLNKYKGSDTKETYTNRQGYKMAMPQYYRKLIYNDEEREKLWINKLDENTKYIAGQILKNEPNNEKYYKILEVQRQKNKKLGYGNDEKNWQREEHENRRRDIMHEIRTEEKEKIKLELPQINAEDAF